MVYPYYSKMYPDLRAVIDDLESEYLKQQFGIETEAMARYTSDADAVVRQLTEHSLQSANTMMSRWQQMFQYLVVKHNDMVVKAEENGRFKRTPQGFAAPTIRPSYPERFWGEVVKQTGDRYLMK